MKPLKVQPIITSRDSQAFERYLHDINKIPMITPEEEARLAESYQKTKNKEDLDKLICANLRFVVTVAKQYDRNRGISLQDLVNEGNIGMIKAAERFDPTRGNKFISYAVWWIRQSINQAICDKGAMVRVPGNSSNLYARIMQASSDYLQQHGRQPAPDEIANILGEKEETVIRASANGIAISMDRPWGDDEENATLGDTMATDVDYEADNTTNQEDLRIELERAMSKLPERERSILHRVYGIGQENEAIERIAEDEHLTKERVRQIIDKSLRKLRGLSTTLHTFL